MTMHEDKIDSQLSTTELDVNVRNSSSMIHSAVANPNVNKRKRSSADTFSRVAESTCENAKSGRGSEAGWVHCPLCGRHSKKLFAMGRGIGSHLHAVHTPWKPGKVERQKRRRLEERRKRQLPNTNVRTTEEVPTYKENETWEPTEQEIENWNQKVLKICKELEEDHSRAMSSAKSKDPSNNDTAAKATPLKTAGVNRTGKELKSYSASLSPFIQAAADGNLEKLKEFIDTKKTDNGAVLELLNQRDRHLSTAEHWAAGSGHLECLKYLAQTRKNIAGSETCSRTQHEQRKRIRRRDGKTPLHYAARNGQVNCIKYLIEEQGQHVDEVSGDGTTPFHLAVFGGHLEAMEALWKKHGANVLLTNDFGCNAAHWAGMTKCESAETVRKVCHHLQVAGVSFTQRQKQGHSSLHKAAQRKNRHVIEWMSQSATEAGAGLSDAERREAAVPDEGGHIPSKIWRSMGGGEEFAEWMQNEMGW